MSYYTQLLTDGLKIAPSLGSLTVTGANETLKVTTPLGMSASLLQNLKTSSRVPSNEVWCPIGVYYTITTDVAAAAAKVTLRKNGVSAATGGVATIVAAAAASTVLWAPFTQWTFAAAPAAGDQWSVLVTTVSDTTGIINPVLLAYVCVDYPNITDGIQM